MANSQQVTEASNPSAYKELNAANNHQVSVSGSIFYLHLANTQTYLEEITSYDEPLQNPQKENKRGKTKVSEF